MRLPRRSSHFDKNLRRLQQEHGNVCDMRSSLRLAGAGATRHSTAVTPLAEMRFTSVELEIRPPTTKDRGPSTFPRRGFARQSPAVRRPGRSGVGCDLRSCRSGGHRDGDRRRCRRFWNPPKPIKKAGRKENCWIGVFLAEASGHDHALMDRQPTADAAAVRRPQPARHSRRPCGPR
jgi:hypothetical protein